MTGIDYRWVNRIVRELLDSQNPRRVRALADRLADELPLPELRAVRDELLKASADKRIVAALNVGIIDKREAEEKGGEA